MGIAALHSIPTNARRLVLADDDRRERPNQSTNSVVFVGTFIKEYNGRSDTNTPTHAYSLVSFVCLNDDNANYMLLRWGTIK